MNKITMTKNTVTNKKIVQSEPSSEAIELLRSILRKEVYSTEDEEDIKKFLKLSAQEREEGGAGKGKGYELLSSVRHLHGLENGAWLVYINNDHGQRAGLLKIRKELIKEYSCQAPSELMLIDRIVSAYWRAMRYETRINNRLESPDGISQLGLNIIKEYHRGIELAQRELQVNLTLLQQLKEPRVHVKVSAENAYIAQNQQVINKTENKDK